MIIEKDGGGTIDATFDGPFSGFNTTNQDGGTVAKDSSIKLFGNLQTMYEFSESIKVNKNTKLQFTYPIEGDNVSVCLFLKKDDEDHADGEFRCKEISESTIEVEVGKEMFLSRKVEVKYIGFKQETTFSQPRAMTAELANLRFKETDPSPQVQGGQCIDTNAEITAEQDCLCKLGYVASNGGRILEELDTCVECLQPCRYDGDTCTYDRDCFTGRCSNEKSCVAGVSSQFITCIIYIFIISRQNHSDTLVLIFSHSRLRLIRTPPLVLQHLMLSQTHCQARVEYWLTGRRVQ